MKRMLISMALFAIFVLVLVPTIASAKLTPSKSPRSVTCGTTLKLGVTARNHSGSRRVKVRIYTGKQLVFKRTIRATKHFRKQLTCGKSYRVVYRMPSGRKIIRKVKVLRGAGAGGQGLPASPALPIANSGTDVTLTPQEQQEETQEQAYEDAMAACEALNEQHEDDEDWDPFACWPDDPEDDSDDSDEGDE